MKRVDFVDINDKVLGSVWVENGRIAGRGRGPAFVDGLKVADENGKLVTPADPSWLEDLRYEFRSPYLRAVAKET